ncbi:MAG: aryl-sulfate sulfotransferase [Candidatus Eisenbacteria sp.]|nr:aryl-sulfate sulfotransferase [Candidatus Eisenbacteria bacterium]
MRRLTVVLLLLVFALCSVAASGQERHSWANDPSASSPNVGPSGRWREARAESEPILTEEQKRELEKLRSIGYLAGSQPATSDSGITVHDPARSCGGVNFYTSGHFAGAILMDMDGRVLHEWRYDFLKAWPEQIESTEIDGSEYWRWAYLLENGDVLAIFDGLGLIKVDRNSNLIWEHLGSEHHDLDVTDDGRIFVLTRRAHMIERINERMPILEDFVTVLDSDGRLLKEVSVLEAFENSNFASSPAARGYVARGDIYHTNAVEVLDGSLADRIPAFGKGNVLLSMRSLSTIVVLDMDLGEIVWVASDLWLAQHDPKILDNGNILVFDNKGAQGESRVVEFNPATREMVWVYAGDRSNGFFTKMCGANHRLENGNTLITESDYGRAFEVTPDGEIVWEFINPHRAGKYDDLIATLFDVVRLDPDFSLDWLE